MLKKRTVLMGVILLVVVLGTTVLHASGNWKVIKDLDMDWTFSAVAFLDEWEGWVAGGSPFDQTGYIGHTRDGGKTWEQVETPIETTLTDIYFLDKKHGWAVGQQGMIVGTSNGGRRWDVQTSKVGNWLKGVHFVSPKVGYAVGMDETVVKTTNGGKQWNVLRGGEVAAAVGDAESVVFNAVQFLDESTGWATGVRISPETGGQDALIQLTTDGGNTWTDQPTNIPDILEDIFFADANNGWAVGENGIILHTTNGGNSWDIQTAGTEEKLLSIRFANSTTGWAVGGDYGVSIILHTTDGGETWENHSLTADEAPIISKQQLSDVFPLDTSSVWITGPGGFMISSSK